MKARTYDSGGGDGTDPGTAPEMRLLRLAALLAGANVAAIGGAVLLAAPPTQAAAETVLQWCRIGG